MCDLFVHIKFSQEAAKALVIEGLNSIEELQNVRMGDAETYMKNLRKPGGMSVGYTVSTTAGLNFTTIIWVVNHFVRVSHPFPISKVSVPWLRDFHTQIELEESYDHTTVPTHPKVNQNDPAKMKDSIENYFTTVRGPSGIPILWMFREKLIPIPVPPGEIYDEEEESDDDLREHDQYAGQRDPPSNYSSMDEEMTSRAPIIIEWKAKQAKLKEKDWEGKGRSNLYLKDQAFAYNLLFQIFGSMQAWVNVKGNKKDPHTTPHTVNGSRA